MRCDANFGAECDNPRVCSVKGCSLYETAKDPAGPTPDYGIRPQEIASGKGKENMSTQTCNLVNQCGIIVRQFTATSEFLEAWKYVDFNGKTYQRKYEHGGGHPSFYEVVPYVLHDQDLIAKS